MIRIAVEGIDEAIAAIDALDFNRIVPIVTLAIAEAVRDEVSPYPPATEANNPANKRWYERGYGSRWRRKDGSVGGRRTSETLGRKWIVRRDVGGGAVLTNNASYGEHVHGLVTGGQARHMARIGWKSTKESVQRIFRNGTVDRIVASAIRRGRR